MSDTTWHFTLFGYGELRIIVGHWRDKNNRVFLAFKWRDGWWGRTDADWYRIIPTHDQVRLYVGYLNVDKALEIWSEEANWSTAPENSQQMLQQTVAPDQTIPTLVQESTEPKVSDKSSQPVVMSVVAYGRAHSHGLEIHLVGAIADRYRRNTNGVVEYFDDTTISWTPSKRAPEADQALTAAGWSKDFEIESIAGPYAPTPLEGRWTCFYWRTIETVAMWGRSARWLFFGAK